MMIRLILTLWYCWLVQTTIANTIVVKPGSNKPLTRAIDLAKNGDSIIVEPGVYKEGNIVVNKSIFLIGSGSPVLDGETTYEIMTVSADFVIIEGFIFRHSGKSGYEDIAALRIFQHGHIVIRNNVFDRNFFGIYCQNAYFTTIYNNRFTSNAVNETTSANGIHCWKSDHMMILNNEISGHRDGIYFEFVTESVISGNLSHLNARYGLHFMFSHYNHFNRNIFSDNGAGIAVMYSHHVQMIANQFSNNWGPAAYGILMKDITDSEVRGNYFERNTASIYMEGSNRINIRANTFRQNGWAIKIQASCTDDTISGNNFSGNSFDIATNGSLQLNHFEGNFWDRYEGYDLKRDGTGDIPYRPLSMYSMLVERNPASLILLRSFMSTLMDKAERVLPSLTPEDLKDEKPRMKPLRLKPLL